VTGGEARSFGETVRRLREERKIGLRQFAKMLGVSPTYVSQIERGELPPPAEDKVKAMAKFLGQDADELLLLAGRMPADLSGIVQRRPKEMPSLLRSANGLSTEELQRLIEEVQRKKLNSDDED
jgi:HTH-type transcriptional regulator, competence development regulator